MKPSGADVGDGSAEDGGPLGQRLVERQRAVAIVPVGRLEQGGYPHDVQTGKVEPRGELANAGDQCHLGLRVLAQDLGGDQCVAPVVAKAVSVVRREEEIHHGPPVG